MAERLKGSKAKKEIHLNLFIGCHCAVVPLRRFAIISLIHVQSLQVICLSFQAVF